MDFNMDSEQLREELERRAEELSQDAEMEFLLFFALSHRDEWNDDDFKQQLRALWTALCLHFGVEVDTMIYDNLLARVKNTGIAPEDGSGICFASDFENFMAEFMC